MHYNNFIYLKNLGYSGHYCKNIIFLKKLINSTYLFIFLLIYIK